MTKKIAIKSFHSLPEVIKPTVMLYVRFPVSRRNVEDLIAARTLPIVNPVRCLQYTPGRP